MKGAYSRGNAESGVGGNMLGTLLLLLLLLLFLLLHEKNTVSTSQTTYLLRT